MRSEERACEGLVLWMKGHGGGPRGLGLPVVGAIRFGVMGEGYLGTEAAVEAFAAEHSDESDLVEVVLSHVFRAKAARKQGWQIVMKHLEVQGMTRHAGRGVAWELCEGLRGAEARRASGGLAVVGWAGCGRAGWPWSPRWSAGGVTVGGAKLTEGLGAH